MGNIKKWKVAFWALFFLVIFWGGIGVFVWFFVSSETVRTVITIIGTLTVSIITLSLSKQWEKKLEAEQKLREKKEPLYEEIISAWVNSFLRKPDEEKETEFQNFLGKSAQKMVVWASDNVLNEFIQMVKIARMKEDERKPLLMMMQIERFLSSMRLDLGHENNKLDKGDLLRIFINDIDEHLGKENKEE